jgi:hypothetical protein
MAKPGIGTKHGHEHAPESDDRLTETDLASNVMGDNALQGDDQENVRNQRHAQPDPRQEADSDPVESARRLDKDERARVELSKGARSAEGNPAARPDRGEDE